MKPWHIGVFILWVALVAIMVYFSGAIRIPTKIFITGGFTISNTFSKVLGASSNSSYSSSSSVFFPLTCQLPVGKLKNEPLQMAKSHCRDEQTLFYDSGGKSSFWGNNGLNKFMDSLFNRQGNPNFFTFQNNRPITLVHIGAHLGGIIDSYARLRRGARLEDRLILFEPNPANYERLVRRVRLDPRLVLTNQAISNEESNHQWFSFSSVPNTLGNSGKLMDEKPAEAQEIYIDPSLSKEEKDKLKEKQEGYYVNVTTLDIALQKYPIIDFIFMDPEAWEPRIFLGAKETLAKTRLMVFSCSNRWSVHSKYSTNKRTFQFLSDLGFLIVLLGKERNILANNYLGPDRIYDRLSAWGFCAAIRPEMLTPENNITALAQSLTGYVDTPLRGTNSSFCLRYAAASFYNTCEENRKQKQNPSLSSSSSSSPPTALRG